MPSLHAAVPILHLRLHRADSFRERSHLDLEICGKDASQGVPFFVRNPGGKKNRRVQRCEQDMF